MKKKESEGKLEKLLADFIENLTVPASTAKASKTGEFMEPCSQEMESLSEEETNEILSLFETARTISSVIKPKQPSEELIDTVSYAAQKRFEEQISTEKIQRIIGMAVTMEGFRKSLFNDIVAACRSVGLTLTPREIAALRNLKEDAVKEFANSLDERITKFFPTNLP